MCYFSSTNSTFIEREYKRQHPSDPADWPVLSDKARTELVSRETGRKKSDFIFSEGVLGGKDAHQH